jgi:hypothetical protein
VTMSVADPRFPGVAAALHSARRGCGSRSSGCWQAGAPTLRRRMRSSARASTRAHSVRTRGSRGARVRRSQAAPTHSVARSPASSRARSGPSRGRSRLGMGSSRPVCSGRRHRRRPGRVRRSCRVSPRCSSRAIETSRHRSPGRGTSFAARRRGRCSSSTAPATRRSSGRRPRPRVRPWRTFCIEADAGRY